MEKLYSLIKKCESSALFSWSQGQELCGEFPNALYICPTNICNHRCITCAIHKMRKGKDSLGKQQQGFMDWKLFQKIVSELPKEGRRIYLYKTGEALLHPKILEMMAYIKQERPEYEVALNTNAAKMDEKMACGLLDHADYIGISIFGITKESYLTAHRRDNFDVVLNNIDFLHKEYVRRKETKKIYFYIVRCSANEQFSDDELFDFFLKRYPHFNVGINGLFNFYNELDDIKFEFTEHIEEQNMPKCIIPHTIMPITWDGKVASCIADPLEKHIMGDVSVSTIAEIWNNEKYKNFRKLMHEGNYSLLKAQGYLCKECSWLFALKTHSTENLCMAYRRQHKTPRAVFLNDQPKSTIEYMELGLRAYLYGDISEAIKSFIIAERGSNNSDMAALAAHWKKLSEDVVGMRKDIDYWEQCMNKMGTSLNTFMINKYKIANPDTSKLHTALSQENGVHLKKTEL